DEVILVAEGNVFAVGTDVQGVFGDSAESVFGLSCLEVSESDRERSQGGDTILVDEECPVDEIVDLPSPGGGQFPGVHVHHTQGGKTVFEAAVRLHVDEHGGTRGRKIHRLNGTWIDQPVQCTFRLRPQVFMEFTRRDVESCVKADRRIFVLITRGAHGDHAPDGGEDGIAERKELLFVHRTRDLLTFTPVPQGEAVVVAGHREEVTVGGEGDLHGVQVVDLVGGWGKPRVVQATGVGDELGGVVLCGLGAL